MNDLTPETITHLTAQLKRHEEANTFSPKPYRCKAGRLTIGWGQNIEANPLTGFIKWYYERHLEITLEMADYLLDVSLRDAILKARAHFPVWGDLDDVRRAVIVNMIFNMGIGGVLLFYGFRACLAKKDYIGAAEHMRSSLWYRQLGGDPPGTDDGILERPEELIKMMLTGTWVK